MTRISPSAVRSRDGRSRLHWRRALLATTAALSLGQNAAWATCLDGSTLPPRRLPDRRRAGGGRGQLVAERLHRDGRLLLHPGQLDHRSGHRRTHGRRAQLGLRPGLYALQGWVMPAAQPGPPAWILPPNTSTIASSCRSSRTAAVTNLGDIPFQGSVVTPVCDPTKLSTRAGGPTRPTPTPTSSAARSPLSTTVASPRPPLRPPRRPSCSSPASRAACSTISWTTTARSARPSARSATTATSPRG